jgi:hypothetical protein
MIVLLDPPLLRRYPDGSFQSRIGTVQLRVIEGEITIAVGAGRHTGSTGWPPPCSTGASIRRPSWSLSTISAGRSRPPSSS